MTDLVHPELGAYRHTVPAGELLWISGQVPLDRTGALVGPADPGAQATQVFENVRGVLASAGAGLADVVKLTTFLVDAADAGAVAAARAEIFGELRPASTVVIVGGLLDPAWLLEVEAVALRGGAR